MTIYIDVSAAVHQRAGMARYAESLTRAMLAAHAHEHSFGIFYNRDRSIKTLSGLGDLPARCVDCSYKPWRMAVWLGQVAGVGFNSILPDVELYHATEHLLMPLRGIPTVLTVHDLIFRLFPEYHKRLNYWYLNAAMPVFTRKASALVAISECSKRDLVRLYGIPAEKISVVYEAASPHFQPASKQKVAEVRFRYGLPDHYMLALGTIEPRKNLIRLVSALRVLRQRYADLALVVVGSTGWLYHDLFHALEELHDPKAVLLAGYVPDEDLPAVISGASLYVLASLYEGFGLPILEAMACGTPVVCSNTSSMPELGNQAARYFDPYDIDSMVEELGAVLSDAELRADMRARGLVRASHFSWRQAADQTFALYQRLLSEGQTSPPNQP